MKRRWKKFLAGVLSAALALNLAAPLALADSGGLHGGRSWYCLVMLNSVTARIHPRHKCLISVTP